MPLVTTTAFSTPCLKSVLVERRRWLFLSLPVLLWFWAICMSLLPAAAFAQGRSGATITQMRLEQADDGVYFSAAVQFELPSRRDVKKCVVTRDTVERGMPPTLVTEAAPERERERRAESA